MEVIQAANLKSFNSILYVSILSETNKNPSCYLQKQVKKNKQICFKDYKISGYYLFSKREYIL